MAHFKSIIAHMSKERLQTEVVIALAAHAGIRLTMLRIMGGEGYFTKRDEARIASMLKKLSKRKKPVTAPAIKLAHELVRHAAEVEQHRNHRGFSCAPLLRIAAKRLVIRG